MMREQVRKDIIQVHERYHLHDVTIVVDAQQCPLVALQMLGSHGAEYII